MFSWGHEEEAVFLRLKKCLASYPVLICPDFKRTLTLCTDASIMGLGVVLKAGERGGRGGQNTQGPGPYKGPEKPDRVAYRDVSF